MVASKLLDRLSGLETEYAVRWSPTSARSKHPTAEDVFEAIKRSAGELIETRPGGSRSVFTAYGGALSLEMGQLLIGALVEGGTPECRGPSTLLLYQRVQDDLLTRALPGAEVRLNALGFEGQLGLLKNCRDAEGNLYGAQENYELELCSGARRAFYLLGLIALMPLLVVCSMLCLSIDLLFGLFLLLVLLLFMLSIPAALVSSRYVEAVDRLTQDPRWLRHLSWIMRFTGAFMGPVAVAYYALLRAFGFVPYRRQSTAFLLSRPIFSGAGTLDEAGALHIAEKAYGLTTIMRWSNMSSQWTLFDTTNLFKGLAAPMHGRLEPLRALFGRRQRLQLGCSDSNMCQWAEFLKLGTTQLIWDMVEDGALRDAPVLIDPLGASRAWADPTLQATAKTRAHGEMSALDVQRFYQARAEQWLSTQAVVSVEARRVVGVWAQALDALEAGQDNPEQHPLVGRVDWITKRALLAKLPPHASLEARKKLDLKYHELGVGYHEKLSAAGLTEVLVDAQMLEEAKQRPPEDSPAHHRGVLIRRFAQDPTPVHVSWRSVSVGGKLSGRLGAKVIQLRPKGPRSS